MSAIVVLSGGSPHAHDFDRSGRALTELAASTGARTTTVSNPDDLPALLGSDSTITTLIVNGLWWTMQGEAYDPWREHAYRTPPATREAISRFVLAGGGLVANHTAAICFDDWPEWGDIVGGSWQWGVSAHPPCGPVTARIVAAHPVTAGLSADIHITDEVYGDLDVRPDIEVLAVARRGAADDEQPVVWAHHFGAGRVVFDCFGHDDASIRHPDNARLLRQALGWVSCGADETQRSEARP